MGKTILCKSMNIRRRISPTDYFLSLEEPLNTTQF
nr:MAG TPA: hypothetical protein [Caudoviricetes sp.]